MNHILRSLTCACAALALYAPAALAAELQATPVRAELMLTSAADPPGSVVLGGKASIAKPGAHVRQVTRFERYAATPPDTEGSRTLVVLSDADFALQTLPKEVTPLASVVNANAKGAVVLRDYRPPVAPGTAPEDEPPAESSIEFSLFHVLLGWAGLTVLFLAYRYRTRLLELFSLAVFYLVSAVRYPVVRIAGQPKRRRRQWWHARRQRTAEIRWYFQAERRGRRSRHGRWSSTRRQREFVVSDVVFESTSGGRAPPYSGKYLLSCNNN